MLIFARQPGTLWSSLSLKLKNIRVLKMPNSECFLCLKEGVQGEGNSGDARDKLLSLAKLVKASISITVEDELSFCEKCQGLLAAFADLQKRLTFSVHEICELMMQQNEFGSGQVGVLRKDIISKSISWLQKIDGCDDNLDSFSSTSEESTTEDEEDDTSSTRTGFISLASLANIKVEPPDWESDHSRGMEADVSERSSDDQEDRIISTEAKAAAGLSNATSSTGENKSMDGASVAIVKTEVMDLESEPATEMEVNLSESPAPIDSDSDADTGKPDFDWKPKSSCRNKDYVIYDKTKKKGKIRYTWQCIICNVIVTHMNLHRRTIAHQMKVNGGVAKVPTTGREREVKPVMSKIKKEDPSPKKKATASGSRILRKQSIGNSKSSSSLPYFLKRKETIFMYNRNMGLYFCSICKKDIIGSNLSHHKRMHLRWDKAQEMKPNGTMNQVAMKRGNMRHSPKKSVAKKKTRSPFEKKRGGSVKNSSKGKTRSARGIVRTRKIQPLPDFIARKGTIFKYQANQSLFFCSICKMNFIGKDLADHKKKHGIGLDVCDICNKSFFRKQTYLDHQKKGTCQVGVALEN